MDKYIEREALLEMLEKLKEHWGNTFTAEGVSEAIEKVEQAPTADVVPRVEVDKWVSRCREWREVAELKPEVVKKAQQMVAREILLRTKHILFLHVMAKMTNEHFDVDAALNTLAKDYGVDFNENKCIEDDLK